MDRLGRKNPYQLSFQSKIGPVKWLEPATNDVIIGLGKQGVDDVLVVPISFVSEHIETLYELDILYKKVAKDAGVANFRRVPALNSDPVFIRALADIVQETLNVSQADVVVVGAGITGLTCAYRLQKLGIETLVLESAASHRWRDPIGKNQRPPRGVGPEFPAADSPHVRAAE